MGENAILINPTERANVATSVTQAVRQIVYLDGFMYGIRFAAGTTDMYKFALFDSPSTVTLDTSVNNVQSICTDGTYLYAVEERTGSAGATTNQILKIETDGTVTVLTSTEVNMRSVVYDSVNNCLYASAPFDDKILQVTGGGIGGDDSDVVISDFIDGIDNGPGRLCVNRNSTVLYFTTEETSKQLASVSLVGGVPGSPAYYDILGGVGETTCFVYIEDFDTFLYAGPNATTGVILTPRLFSMGAGLTAGTRFCQGALLDDNSIVYTDGTTGRYVDLTA